MTPALILWADMAVSAAAIAGLWCLNLVLRAAGAEDPVVRRFRFGLAALMLIYGGRLLSVGLGAPAFRAVEYLGAALIPLAVILLTEGLLRRHAPPWVKGFVGIGAAVGCGLAVMPSGLVDPARILMVMLFQIGSFVIAGWLVLRRDAGGLTASENKAAERLALSLLFIVPLGASDFLILVFDLPIRISGLAALVMCWLAIGLWRGDAAGGHRTSVAAIVTMVLCGAAASWIVVAAAGFAWRGGALAVALILTAIVLSMVVTDARMALDEIRRPSILRHLRDFDGRDAVAFFRRLAGHPAVEGAVFIEAGDLADLDPALAARLFTERPVLKRREAPLGDPELADLAGHLFAVYEATHILEVRRAPQLLLALALPTVAGTRTEEELAVAQRMAALMERGDD